MSPDAVPGRRGYSLPRFSYWFAHCARYSISNPKGAEDVRCCQCPWNKKIGSNLEAAFTTSESGLENSSSHHRVVPYALGDLKFVVRFEADACCKEKENPQVLDKGCVNFYSPLRGEDLQAKFNQMSSIEAGGAADA